MSDLVLDHVKGRIDRQLTGMSPDGDIDPALITVGKRGLNTLCLGAPTEESLREELMKAVIAYLVVTEAETVVLAAGAQSPGRPEVILLAQASRDGATSVHTAEVIRRRNQPPVLGFWEGRESPHGLSGMLGEALEVGLGLAGSLSRPGSAGLRGYLDALWDQHDVPFLVKTVSDGLRRVDRSDDTRPQTRASAASPR